MILTNVSFIKRNIAVFAILSAVVYLVFNQLTQTFYQQDEWYSLGVSYVQGPSFIFNNISSPLDLLLAKGRILSTALGYLFISSFPLQNTQMAIFAISLHIIASFLVFVLIEKFIYNRFISLLGALFFTVNSVSHSAITWPIVAINTITSTLIIVLGVILFFKYLSNSKIKWLISSVLAIYISLFFKETGLYMLIFLPISALLFNRYKIYSFIKTFWYFLLPFLFIVGYRVVELKFRTTSSNLYITGQNEDFFLTILLRAFFYPLTSFSLMFAPGEYLLTFARTVLSLIYPFFARQDNNILIAQTIVLDLLAVFLSCLILMLIILLLQKEKVVHRRFVIFWLMFTLMSFLPYVLLSKDLSYLESRYYYLSVIGGAFLLSWILTRLKILLKEKIFYFVVIPCCLFFLFLHVSAVHNIISELTIISNIRKDFILQIKTLVPSLENKRNVFYVTSSQNYWVDGNKIPFQQGSGYTLMVLYYESGKIPKEFLQPQGPLGEGFLFDIGSQGYKQSLPSEEGKEGGEYGFGYFWEKQELEKTMKMYNLPPESIISLHYDSNAKKLIKNKND